MRISLDCLVLTEIRRSSKRKIVPFPLVFYRLGCMFHLDKATSRLILSDLQKKGLIRIHDFHGVEILKEKNRETMNAFEAKRSRLFQR